MFDEIYLGISIALVSVMFTFGLLFYFLRSNTESPVFRRAMQMMVFNYIFCGVVTALKLWVWRFMPGIDCVLLFKISTIIASAIQILLFTHVLMLLINAAYVTRKRMLREIVPLCALSGALVFALFILPDDWIKISVVLFNLFYIYLLIKYIWLFTITYRNSLRKMDNFFSGQEKQHLKWVSFSFYIVWFFAVLVLIIDGLPAMLFCIICTASCIIFHIFFAIRFIKHGFFHKELEKALTDDNMQPEQLDEGKNTVSFFCEDIEKNLKLWIENKLFLQIGVTIEDVSRQIATNKKYLSVYINVIEHKTFRDWVNDLRIEEAKRLLKESPSLTLQQIAELTGYATNSHFSATFKKNTGKKFTEYRKDN